MDPAYLPGSKGAIRPGCYSNPGIVDWIFHHRHIVWTGIACQSSCSAYVVGQYVGWIYS